MKNIKELIESDKSAEDILKTTLKEQKRVGDPVVAMEGDQVKLKDGKEYQLQGHYWYSDTRDPIAISTGQETVLVWDGSREKELPITHVVAVMAHEEGDRRLRRVKYVESEYGESELVYTE